MYVFVYSVVSYFKPTPDEKELLAREIVKVFPVLRCATGEGHVRTEVSNPNCLCTLTALFAVILVFASCSLKFCQYNAVATASCFCLHGNQCSA